MHLKPITSLTFLALGSALLFAASWEKKDFFQWNEKDVQKILSDSPWSKNTRIPLGSPSMSGQSMPTPTPPTAPSGGGSGDTSSGSTGGGGTSGPPSGAPVGGGGAEMAGPTPEAPVLIQWISATPIRLAQLKSQPGKTPSQADIDNASKPMDSYAVAVIGVPKGLADPQSLQTAATLTPKKKDPIKSSQVKVQPVGGGEAYIFIFPKTPPLALEDKDVEFRLEAAKLDIKKKFSLKDMQYQGKLAI